MTVAQLFVLTRLGLRRSSHASYGDCQVIEQNGVKHYGLLIFILQVVNNHIKRFQIEKQFLGLKILQL
jgi:hypothetical protein